jgi:hypothetical protein
VSNPIVEDLKQNALRGVISQQIKKTTSKGVIMNIKSSDVANQAPLLEKKPYQTPKLEVHEAYNALTTGIGLSIGLVQPFPSILDDSVSLDPQELGI